MMETTRGRRAQSRIQADISHDPRALFDSTYERIVHRPFLTREEKQPIHFIMSSNDAPSSSAGASSSKPLVPFFKKSGRARPASTRKRSASPSGSDTAEAAAQQEELIPSSVIRPQAKSSLAQPIVQGTKRSRAPDPAKEATRKLLAENDWKASESSLEESEERRRGFVTRSKDWDLEEGQEVDGEEAEARLGKRSRTDDAAPTIDGMYHGSAGYNTYIRPKEVTNSKIRAGPIKATSNIRAVTVTDYQPDVCKDYKETGFCGYGDSCKFLHDRGDYLAGWQLDKLAVNPTTGQTVEEEDSDDEDVPFACLICRQPFTEPIVTKCGHYFCMK